jgi:hypothetical protein
MKRFLSIIFLFLIFNSCKKLAPEVNADFVGYWRSKTSPCEDRLIIRATGSGHYEVYATAFECKGGVKGQGKVKYKNETLYFGGEKFYVESMPEPCDTTYFWDFSGQETSVTSMTLRKSFKNGSYKVTFYRIIGK